MPFCPALGTVDWILLGCHAPIHATFLRPLWVFLGSFLVCHLLVTPLYPWPLVTPMMSIISSWPNTSPTFTSFSKCSRAKLTLSAMDPPLSWTSMMCAFFCLRRRSFIWVWTMILMVVQYFFIWLRSFSISFLPKSSAHLVQDLVNAFFLLFFEPGRSISRTMWDMPALYPMKQVMWTGLLGSSLGNDFGFPRWRLALFLGRNPFDP